VAAVELDDDDEDIANQMILVFGSLLVCGVAASSDMTAIPMWLLHQYYDNEDANCAASSPNEELVSEGISPLLRERGARFARSSLR
jgi:hypothetical protein